MPPPLSKNHFLGGWNQYIRSGPCIDHLSWISPNQAKPFLVGYARAGIEKIDILCSHGGSFCFVWRRDFVITKKIFTCGESLKRLEGIPTNSWRTSSYHCCLDPFYVLRFGARTRLLKLRKSGDLGGQSSRDWGVFSSTCLQLCIVKQGLAWYA